MVLLQKQPFLQGFFFRQFLPGKCLLGYSSFWSKNGHFSNFFFLEIIGQENVFYDILEGKNAFLGYKKKRFKTSKSWHFSKGINPWFYSKNSHFCTFFFQAILARKMSCRIFQNEKTPFEAIKTRSSRSHKIDIFPKGLTHAFGQKMAIFLAFFFFRKYRPEKCPLRYSRTSKPLQE